MVKNFVCLHCRGHFSAEEASNTVCPYCKSDNIKINSSSSSKLAISFVCFVVFAAVGYFIPIDMIIGSKQEATPVVKAAVPATQTIPQPADNRQTAANTNTADVQAVDMSTTPKIIAVTDPVLNGSKYDINVEARVEKGRLSYEIRKEPGYELVQSNNSGRFTGIPYSESGMYRIEVINTNFPEKKEYQLVSGFEKPAVSVPSIEKASAADIESYLNNNDLNSLKKISRNARISISNPEEAQQTPADFNGVILNLKMEVWERVTVEKVNYNEQNYITSVRIRVTPK